MLAKRFVLKRNKMHDQEIALLRRGCVYISTQIYILVAIVDRNLPVKEGGETVHEVQGFPFRHSLWSGMPQLAAAISITN